jgi:hypothetical protein
MGNILVGLWRIGLYGQHIQKVCCGCNNLASWLLLILGLFAI